jgi:hypothetical protein
MLMSGGDVLELHPGGTVKLHGIFDVFALFADQLHVQAGLLEDLAHGRVIRKFTLFYMATWW